MNFFILVNDEAVVCLLYGLETPQIAKMHFTLHYPALFIINTYMRHKGEKLSLNFLRFH
jgi:hypothetical protein